MPIERPRTLIIMYARCLIIDLKLCLIRLINMMRVIKKVITAGKSEF